MSSISQYQTLSLQLYLLQDEACPLTKERLNKRMEIQGQTPAKTLIIHFHLHLSTNKQWLTDFKILSISSTNTKIPFMKSISEEWTINKLCYSLKSLTHEDVLQIHWNNVFHLGFIFVWSKHNIFASSFICFKQWTYFLYSKIRTIVIFTASITSAPLTC